METPGAQLRFLFLDLNSYFASVEQQRRPELRGKPVGVVPVDADSTCCIAASVQAKKYGVTTGTRVKEARQRCPEITFVVACHAEYVRYHHRICAAVQTCLPIEAVHSIDEMSCRLNSDESEPKLATVLAQRVKQGIREQVGAELSCSIGLAPNRFLAKVASDLKKPDGLVVIGRCDLPGILYDYKLKLRDLPGIGMNMEIRLNRAGIYTLEDLCATSEHRMDRLWGVNGRRLWRWLRGEETELPARCKQSVGHQHVLPRELRTDEKARGVAVRLLHKTAARLRYMGYFARGFSLRVGLEGMPEEESAWSVKVRLSPTQDTLELLTILAELWKSRPRHTPCFIDVTLFDLQAAGMTAQPLFEEERRVLDLNRAMDRINQKFGRNSIYSASMMGSEDTAPGGIAFSSIPSLEFADTVPERRERSPRA